MEARSTGTTALDVVAQRLEGHRRAPRRAAIGALVSPHSTLEELALAARLDARRSAATTSTSACGTRDFRDRASALRWLGMPIADIGTLRPRARRRQLPAQGPSAARAAAAPGGAARAREVDAAALGRRRLAACRSTHKAIVAAVAAAARCSRTSSPPWRRQPASRCPAGARRASSASRRRRTSRSRRASCRASATAILLGNYAEQHPESSQLHALAQALADMTGATLGFLREAANTRRRRRSRRRAAASRGGIDAQAMLDAAAQGVPRHARGAGVRLRQPGRGARRRSSRRTSSSR